MAGSDNHINTVKQIILKSKKTTGDTKHNIIYVNLKHLSTINTMFLKNTYKQKCILK